MNYTLMTHHTLVHGSPTAHTPLPVITVHRYGQLPSAGLCALVETRVNSTTTLTEWVDVADLWAVTP